MKLASFQRKVRRFGAAGGLIAATNEGPPNAAWRGDARHGSSLRGWTTWAGTAIGALLLAGLAACGGGNEEASSSTTASPTTADSSSGNDRVSTLSLPGESGMTTTAAVTPTAAAATTVVATKATASTPTAANSTSALPTAATTAAITAAITAWVPCAVEGRTCAFTGVRQVRFGALSKYVTLTLSGGTACSNAVFGDPVVGTVKTCALANLDTVPGFAPSDWTLCAAEGGSCNFDGSRQVRYGTLYWAVTRIFAAGPAACANAVFGDPVIGAAKSCWYGSLASAAPTWTPCATENQRCSFAGSRSVRYGTATSFVTGTYTDGVNCASAVFGDPARGMAKACSYSSAVSTAPPPVPPTTTPGTFAAVTLPAVTVAVMGATTQLAATVVDASGTPISGATIAWTIADPTIATLDTAGIATPLRPGFTTITANVGDKSASGVLTVRGSMPIPTRSQYVGTNLGGLAYYGTNFPFANMLKSGSGWGPSNGSPFPSTSADGYPTSLAPGQHATAVAAWSYTHYPAGRYTLLWDGDGTMNFPWGNLRIVSSAPNRIVVEPIDLTGPLVVGIATTNPSNPVRNVRFLWPGTEATHAAQPFNPVYLAKIAPFSLLRFMDWAQTNGSPVIEWADRSLPSNATYTNAPGVPIEVMIDLANSLHVDPWFCIPHKASDDYVRKFAALLHARLDPTLRPHIEYSNEVWNPSFPQTAWASAQSDLLGLQRPWGTPSIFYAWRSVQIFKLLQQVYGSTDAHRLVRVLSGQSSWTQFMQNALTYSDTAANADVLAIAPYFSADSARDPANVVATLGLNANQIVDQMFVSVRGSIKWQMATNAALAAQYHLKMEAYESGPGDSVGYFPAANQNAMTALFAGANASPRMKDLYTEYYSQWKAVGGETMNQYSDIGVWSKWGFWGALQYVTDDVTTAPKYQGLIGFIAANPTIARQTTLQAPRSAAK